MSFTELFGGTLSFATETADTTVHYSDVSAADADEPDSKLPSRAEQSESVSQYQSPPS